MAVPPPLLPDNAHTTSAEASHLATSPPPARRRPVGRTPSGATLPRAGQEPRSTRYTRERATATAARAQHQTPSSRYLQVCGYTVDNPRCFVETSRITSLYRSRPVLLVLRLCSLNK